MTTFFEDLCEDPGTPFHDTCVVGVTDYKTAAYEGWGKAIFLTDKDEVLVYEHIGHCSCYGPFDNAPDVISLERWQEMREGINVDHCLDPKVEAKFNELLDAYLERR